MSDPDEVRATADAILSGAEYREPQPSLIERIFEAIGDALGRVFEALAGSGPGSAVGTVVIVALAVVALVFLVRSLGVSGGGTRRRRARAVVVGTEAATDPDVWLAEADRLLAAGDRRGALRCRHQATVARLTRANVLDPLPGRTPRELAAAIAAAAPAVADAADAMTSAFESAWYGRVPVDAATYDRFTVDAARVEAAASTAVVVPA